MEQTMSYTMERMAKEFFDRQLTNGQALAEAYRTRLAYLCQNPYMANGDISKSASRYAADIVIRLTVMRADAAASAPSDAADGGAVPDD